MPWGVSVFPKIKIAFLGRQLYVEAMSVSENDFSTGQQKVPVHGKGRALDFETCEEIDFNSVVDIGDDHLFLVQGNARLVKRPIALSGPRRVGCSGAVSSIRKKREEMINFLRLWCTQQRPGTCQFFCWMIALSRVRLQ